MGKLMDSERDTSREEEAIANVSSPGRDPGVEGVGEKALALPLPLGEGLETVWGGE